MFTPASSDKYRSKFIDSIISFIQTFGFDGIDFDWEYPGFEHAVSHPQMCSNKGPPPLPALFLATLQQHTISLTILLTCSCFLAPSSSHLQGQPVFGQTDSGSPDDVRDCSKENCAYPDRKQDGVYFSKLVTELRTKLAPLRTASGEPYLMTMAGPGGSDKLAKMDLAAVCGALDFVNIMTYDLAGAWDITTGHQSALFGSSKDASIDAIVSAYVAGGCTPSQLNMGVPFYGRTFLGAQPGPNPSLPGLGASFDKPQTSAASESVAMPSAQQVQALGYTTYWDANAQASYAYSADSKTFITYDNEQAVRAKTEYIQSKGLGGAMVWALGLEYPALWQTLAQGVNP